MDYIKKVILLTVVLLLAIPAVAGAQHIVKPGDTMGKIAVQYGMSLEQIEVLNPHIENIDWIYPNQHINITSNHLAEDIIGYARSLQGITDYV
ncbi:LysM peptidoglycan-binding domain-containing protein [Radiobacillus sp. PE A8.2]|uniref:LysM peptidoglycan-binding domain-containing protein n=1 Tax=Radiobacillus sp. PE A8.2 TaxID=3380349 RepID=UPI00388DB87A